MADTTTANLGLILPDLNDVFSFGTHVIPNFSTIDGLMGAVPCLSTARPSTTYAGQIAYEKDSGRYIQNTGTKASPSWTYMSHGAQSGLSTSLPTSGLSNGFMYYATDQNAMMVSDGGALRYKTIVACTSSTRPASGVVEAGAEIYETDTKRFLIWSGSAWEQKAYTNQVVTSSTHPGSPFQGLEIYESDTTMSAVYSGSNYQYGVQQIAPTQSVSAAASLTFSSIPAVKRVLLVWRMRLATATSGDLGIQLDGNTANSYVWSKSQARAATSSVQDSGGLVANGKIGVVTGNTANYCANGAVWIDGWNQSSTFPTWSGTSTTWDTSTSYWCEQYAGLFGAVGPHTSIKLFPSTSTFTGEATLYGVM